MNMSKLFRTTLASCTDPRWIAGAFLCATSACSAGAASDGEPTAAFAAKDAGSSADSHGYYGNGTASSSADAGTMMGPGKSGQAQGGAIDGDENLGLKPGGAQDINFFRMKLGQKSRLVGLNRLN